MNKLVHFVFLSLFTFLNVSVSTGQIVMKKSGLSSGGGSVSVANKNLIYALGEIAVQETGNNNLWLSEGFVGPDITSVLAIEDYTQLQGVKVYPNPVNDYLNISFDIHSEYEIYIYDLTGKQILFVAIGETLWQYNISSLKTGMYLLGIVDRKNKKAVTIKLQKL